MERKGKITGVSGKIMAGCWLRVPCCGIGKEWKEQKR